MTAAFVHLRNHTEYSLIDGILRIKPWLQTVAEQGMPAVALTDQHNLFAAVKFFRAAVANKVKPIFGAEIVVRDDDQRFPLVLLCQNQEGYLNLTRLLSYAYIDGQDIHGPTVLREWITAESVAGLIALSGGRFGDIGQALLAENPTQAQQYAIVWQQCFPDRFYIELQRTGREHEERYIDSVLAFASQHDLPVVATNDVRFIDENDFDAHEARVCIHDGEVLTNPKRRRLYTQQQYCRTPTEMIELFSDIPEAITNSVEIAKRCNVKLSLGTPYLPDFPMPEGFTTESYLAHVSQEGLQKRLAVILASHQDDFDKQAELYHQRLQIELDVINRMGFPGYFLIVADFIQWAKNNGIPVGPGRGSGAGSLVAYALGITDLDPLQYELLFERFLNPERVSMPDFDVDFCMEGRDRVIDYVAEKYGRDSVSQIITYGSMAAKAVVRDVGRVFSHPYGFVDKIAKLIPFEIGMTLDKALEQEDDLRQRYEDEEEVKSLIDLARKLEGITRNAGKHAGGVVIAPSKLTDFVPLYCEPGGANLVTQFDKDDVEAVGLVKFDFLGLRTLTIINWACQIINTERAPRGEAPIDISLIPTDDVKTFDLLKACNTTAVFQLESRGMKELINRLQPDCFEDIIALVALFRPGPLQSGMVDDFIDRKHGRANVEYPHPELEPILKPTYGVILYQEQVMQIAQVLAGYTLGAADLLRRAMGKKKPEEMAKQRDIFTEGALARGVEEKTATYIFDLMEKFAGYGFNKSHSAAYALVAYQTAWLKAHYPAAFMAAVLSSDMDNTDKVVSFIEDCQQLHIDVLPPHVQHSAQKFTIVSDTQIRYGLGAIKGVGESAIESIIQQRGEGYADLFALCSRVDTRKVNRRVLEALIRAGACDGLGPNRASLMASIDKALKVADQQQANARSGQTDLFAAIPAASTPTFIEQAAWAPLERLQGEKATLGLYLTGHPYAHYQQELSAIAKTSIAQLQQRRDSKAVIAGLIIATRSMITKRGDRMGFITLDDGSGRVEAAIFADDYVQYKDMLQMDTVVVAEGEVSPDDYTGGIRMRAQRFWTVAQARSDFGKTLQISVDPQQVDEQWSPRLQAMLRAYQPGDCSVTIYYQQSQAQAHYRLGSDWLVLPTDQCLQALRDYFGQDQVKVCY